MKKQLTSFINGIKDKTGVEFAVFDLSGQYLAGRVTQGERAPSNLDGVFQDKSADKTYFPITFNGQKVIARLIGSSQMERSYCAFINELASKRKQTADSRLDFFQTLLFGSLTPSKIKELSNKFKVSDKPLFALIINFPKNKRTQVQEFLDDYVSQEDFYLNLSDDSCLFVKYLDGTVEDYSYSLEYAKFTYRELQEATGVLARIGVGGQVDGIKDLSLSYSQAKTTVYLMDVLKSKDDVHTYKEYVLIKMLDELPKEKLKEYLALLWSEQAIELFSDDEMMQTAETFLENNLNVCETARRMYLHRNTLTYRLDKIENLTGLNLRQFNDALTFRLITIISKILR